MNLIAQVQRMEQVRGYGPAEIASVLGVSEEWVRLLMSTDAYRLPQEDDDEDAVA